MWKQKKVIVLLDFDALFYLAFCGGHMYCSRLPGMADCSNQAQSRAPWTNIITQFMQSDSWLVPLPDSATSAHCLLFQNLYEFFKEFFALFCIRAFWAPGGRINYRGLQPSTTLNLKFPSITRQHWSSARSVPKIISDNPVVAEI